MLKQPSSVAWKETASPVGVTIDLRAYYEATMGTIDEVHRFSQLSNTTQASELRGIRNRICNHPVKGVVDLGCGSGQWAQVYAPGASHVQLVDISPSLLAKAALTIRAIRPGLSVVPILRDLFNDGLPELPASFDTCLFAFVLGHASFEQMGALLKSIRLQSPASGRVLIVDSCFSVASGVNRDRNACRYVSLHGIKVGVPKHYFVLEEIAELAEYSGWDVRLQWWGRHTFFVMLGR